MSFGVDEAYGGYGLPAWVTNVILQMIARADAGLMTILGLQAGVADDIQHYASDELKQRYLPGFASGELMGAMDLTEPAGGLGPRRDPHARDGERTARSASTARRSSSPTAAAAVHLVLARDADSYDASLGTTNGLSLYLCPRTLPGRHAERASRSRASRRSSASTARRRPPSSSAARAPSASARRARASAPC